MEAFAADLWEVAQNHGPEEYRDASTFFRKTYLTENIKVLLTEEDGTLPQLCLLFSLPASLMDHTSQTSIQLLHIFLNTVGRKEKIVSPVQESKVAQIIRKRLFQSVDEHDALKVIEPYLDYICREGILPVGMERTEFRRLFLDSYPFLPEVVVLSLQLSNYFFFVTGTAIMTSYHFDIHKKAK
jgi:predicted AAA+ superfamily ATPase